MTDEDIKEARAVIEAAHDEYLLEKPASESFIAAARTGWPAALDALEEARAELERLQRDHNHAVYLSDKRASERDRAEKELHRLKADVELLREHLYDWNAYAAKSIGASPETPGEGIAALEDERDELKAEVSKLKMDSNLRAHANKRLGEECSHQLKRAEAWERTAHRFIRLSNGYIDPDDMGSVESAEYTNERDVADRALEAARALDKEAGDE